MLFYCLLWSRLLPIPFLVYVCKHHWFDCSVNRLLLYHERLDKDQATDCRLQVHYFDMFKDSNLGRLHLSLSFILYDKGNKDRAV